MFSKLRLISKCRQLVAVSSPVNAFRSDFRRCYGADNKPEIIDINFEDMMYEDEDNNNIENNDVGAGDRMLTAEPALKSTGFDGIPIAPIDINPWIEEEEYKQGTVYEETVERKRVISELPEPPANRVGVYVFKGIKITLPKRMLTPGTYRYRLDQEDIEQLADDIRICKFDKK